MARFVRSVSWMMMLQLVAVTAGSVHAQTPRSTIASSHGFSALAAGRIPDLPLPGTAPAFRGASPLARNAQIARAETSPIAHAGAIGRAASGIALPGGGAILAAVDSLPDGTPRIHVQRLDASGAAQWGAQGVEVASSDGGQSRSSVANSANAFPFLVWSAPALVADGSGGVIVVWPDTRSAGPGLYAQRLDTNGARLWGEDGVAIETADPAPGVPIAVSDGAGGTIVAWQDERDGQQYDIYARRVDATGTALWTVDGVKLYSNAYDQLHPAIAADGAGGAVVVWDDQRSLISSDVYAQRVNSSGVRQWGAAGLAVSNGAGEQTFPAIAVSDTFFVVMWQDTRDGTGLSVYGQQLTRAGAASWTAGGVPVCLTPGTRGVPVLVGDGAGGAFVAWSEKRTSPPYWVDVFAQHVNSAGAVQWNAAGAPVLPAVLYWDPSLGDGPLPAVAPDGVGGLHVGYAELSLDHIFQLDVTVQHLDPAGNPTIGGNGTLIGAAPLDQLLPVMIPDGSGGALVGWLDHRASDADVYAQRLDMNDVPQWAMNGAPVYLSPGAQQIEGMIGDGSGGVLVAYAQKIGANYDLFARRFDPSGTPLGPAQPVCVAPELQFGMVMRPDGAGGAYCLWDDLRDVHEALYLQRLDASGHALWTTNGVLVKSTPDYLETLDMVSDGAGGVIIPFRQLQEVPNGNFDLWVQRFGPDGARRWGDAGFALSQFGGDVPWFPVGVPDGQGGAIFAWEDWYPGDRMFAQRVDSTGTSRWTLGGRLIESTHQQLTLPAIASDGAGGAIVAWEDNRGGVDAPDLYAQRLDPSGAAQWTAAGAPVASGPGHQTQPQLLADDAGGVFITWSDDLTDLNLYAQRLAADGTAVWTGGPRRIVTQPGVQDRATIAPDGAGGFFTVWEDARAGAGDLDVYAQRMSSAGNALWNADGNLACLAPGRQMNPAIAPDGSGGVFAAWVDARDHRTDALYLQHLAANGDTLFPNGITSVVVSLVTATVGSGGVELLWQVKDGAIFDLERRTPASAWTAVAETRADGTGRLRYLDTGVSAGGRYGYRLTWNESGVRRTSDETWVEVPAFTTLALVAPNPVMGAFDVTLSLPRPGTATVELLDVGGRRVEIHALTVPAPGVGHLTLGVDRRLAAGVYLIRLTQEGASITRKTCVLR
jgi:hypothetical protein